MAVEIRGPAGKGGGRQIWRHYCPRRHVDGEFRLKKWMHEEWGRETINRIARKWENGDTVGGKIPSTIGITFLYAESHFFSSALAFCSA